MKKTAGLLLIMLITIPAHAQLFGETVTRSGKVNDDLYVAGGTVALNIEANGDVVAAGRRVEIARIVKGDVIAAGGSVDIRGSVLDDVRAAGGDVIARAQIRGDFVAAGAKVLLAPETNVGGRAWLAGGKIEVAGRVARELRIAANEALITGEVQGDVRVIAERLSVGPGAVIHGNLTYQTRDQASIDPAARISGTVTRRPAPAHREPPIGRTGVRLFCFATLIVTAVVVYLLFPAFFGRTSSTLSAHPWASLGLGLALLVTVPFVTAILFATLLGIPLGFLLLAVYFIALPLGLLAGIYFLATLVLAIVPRTDGGRGWHVAAILAACLALVLVRLIPFVGALAWLTLWLIGLGALGLTLFRDLSARR